MPDGQLIAEVWATDGGPNRLATARLIAAAPDLLAAMEEIAGRDDAANESGAPVLRFELRERIDAAIAKARGAR